MCYFIDTPLSGSDEKLAEACPARKQRAVDYINTTKPDIVFISHAYTAGRKVRGGTDHDITSKEWADSMRAFINKFRGNVKKNCVPRTSALRCPDQRMLRKKNRARQPTASVVLPMIGDRLPTRSRLSQLLSVRRGGFAPLVLRVKQVPKLCRHRHNES